MQVKITKPFWCALPNTCNAKLDGASYDTEEQAVAAAEKRSEPRIGIIGTHTVMGHPCSIFVRAVEHKSED